MDYATYIYVQQYRKQTIVQQYFLLPFKRHDPDKIMRNVVDKKSKKRAKKNEKKLGNGYNGNGYTS